MASQNVPGAASYTVLWTKTILVPGITTMAGAASGVTVLGGVSTFWGARGRAGRAVGDVSPACGLMRRVRFQVSDVHTLLDFVDRGLGVAIVPRHVSNKPQASRLVTVALPHDAPRWEVSVVQARRAGSDSATPHLLELVADAPACR